MLRQNKMDEIIKFNEDNCGEIRKIEFIKYIASGDFGDIFMGIYKEEYVAIKIIPYYSPLIPLQYIYYSVSCALYYQLICIYCSIFCLTINIYSNNIFA